MYDELIKSLRETSIDFGESDYVSMMLIEAADAIEELQAQLMFSNDAAKAIAEKVPKWIPVAERLPEIGRKVLVCAYGYEILTARMNRQTENGYPVFQCNGIFLEMAKPGRITHWMPLPEPPESEELNG